MMTELSHPVSFPLQILYANEGESKKEEVAMEPLSAADRSSYIPHKGHEFVLTLYHFPSSCEACPRPLWHVFKPPPALECRRCRVKCHKDHIDRKEEVIAPCRGKKATFTSNNEISFSLLCIFSRQNI